MLGVSSSVEVTWKFLTISSLNCVFWVEHLVPWGHVFPSLTALFPPWVGSWLPTSHTPASWVSRSLLLSAWMTTGKTAGRNSFYSLRSLVLEAGWGLLNTQWHLRVR